MFLCTRRSGIFRHIQQLAPQRSLSLSQRKRKGESETWTQLNANKAATSWTITRSTNADTNAHSGTASSNRRSVLQVAKDQAMVMFLPKGYPRSVTPDYRPYTAWQFMHSVSGTVTGTLSTQALLHALGLGAATSAGLAATTNWIIKDGFGLLGGVLYAGSVATKFDDQPKRFRFLSAALIQFSTLLELLTPLLPHLFVPIASVSNIGKNIGWLASSASRASIHRGFTLCDNLGDVTAKSGAQSTMAGLLGTLLGIGVSYFIGHADPYTLLQVFLPLSAFNMYCCYQSNHAVITRSLNVERGEIALNSVVEEIATKMGEASAPIDPSKIWNENLETLILPLERVSQQESFVFGYKSLLAYEVCLEPSLDRHAAKVAPTKLKTLFEGQNEDYRLLLSRKEPTFHVPTLAPSRTTHSNDWNVCLWFLESSKPRDHIKAFYHSCLARKVFSNRLQQLPVSSQHDFESLQHEFHQSVLDTTGVVEETFNFLLTAMVRKGWHVEFNHFGDRDARISVEKGNIL